MGQRIGILAGSGRFVPLAVADLQRQGVISVVAGIEGEAARRLEKISKVFRWFKVGDAGKTVSFFRENHIEEVMMLGKVRPQAVLRSEPFDRETWTLVSNLKDQSPTAILRAAVGFLEASGFRVLDPVSLLKPYFCEPGTLTQTSLPGDVAGDIDFGLRLARQIADLDVGQTLVVKNRAVIAVEGAEGTDRAILRGGRLAGPGFSVVKAGRTSQDMRLDVPAVGLDTVKAIIRAGGVALGLEASKVVFFQKAEALALADAHGMAIVAREAP
jgi:DUF1009 family protein